MLRSSGGFPFENVLARSASCAAFPFENVLARIASSCGARLCRLLPKGRKNVFLKENRQEAWERIIWLYPTEGMEGTGFTSCPFFCGEEGGIRIEYLSKEGVEML